MENGLSETLRRKYSGQFLTSLEPDRRTAKNLLLLLLQLAFVLFFSCTAQKRLMLRTICAVGATSQQHIGPYIFKLS